MVVQPEKQCFGLITLYSYLPQIWMVVQPWKTSGKQFQFWHEYNLIFTWYQWIAYLQYSKGVMAIKLNLYKTKDVHNFSGELYNRFHPLFSIFDSNVSTRTKGIYSQNEYYLPWHLFRTCTTESRRTLRGHLNKNTGNIFANGMFKANENHLKISLFSISQTL